MTIPLTLPDLAAAYATGTTPAQIIEQVYARIAEVADPAMFITLRAKDDVLAEAQALGAASPDRPLWGVPFAVKDNIDVAGMPTTAACPAWEYLPDADAFVVGLLRAAGALVIGKTNLDQFATGLVGVRSPYGVPRNAIDPLIVPGGSSSGSGVAVAQGIVSFALGTDTAGSGRVPAALNNIVGLKPSLGSWSARGSVPACRSIETISVLALTVEDAYTVYRTGAVHDPQDAYARDIAAPPLCAPPADLRIGVPDASSLRFFGDEAQAQSYADSLDLLRASGHRIIPVDFTPFHDVAQMLYEGAWVAERHSVIQDLLTRDPKAVHPVTAAITRKAEAMSATDAFRGFYRLKELARKAQPMLQGVDMLCVPTIPTFYSIADLEADPVTPNSNLGTYTNFVNLLDMCGLAIPVPTRRDGRPGNVTLLAASGQDMMLASLSACLEGAGPRSLGATGWPLPPRGTPAALPADHMKLVVCGAHLSGLTLNGQLTTRGAYLLEKTFAAPFYRLFALKGNGISRPGMVRVNAPQETAIAVEVWAMPQAQMGSFLAGIPAPLGLGRVRLASGEEACGFVCEDIGAKDATDITESGGWRAWIAQ